MSKNTGVAKMLLEGNARIPINQVEQTMRDMGLSWDKRVDTAGSLVFFDKEKKTVAIYTKCKQNLSVNEKTVQAPSSLPPKGLNS